MASTIAAITTGVGGVVTTADATGNLSLLSGTTTIVAVTSTGAAVTGTLSASGVSTFAAGTALLPSLTTTGDTNTGVWFPAADTIAASTAGSERMRIDSSGTVLINATSLGSNTGTLYVAGSISAHSLIGRQGIGGTSNGNSINFWWTGSALQAWVDTTNVGNVSLTSDYRTKKNIVTNEAQAIERIAQIRPVTYEIADYKTLYKADGIQREGFIAHELAEVIPSAVEGEKDAEHQIQSLKLDALCSVMVKAIQEQQTIINDLKARITALEAR